MAGLNHSLLNNYDKLWIFGTGHDGTTCPMSTKKVRMKMWWEMKENIQASDRLVPLQLKAMQILSLL